MSSFITDKNGDEVEVFAEVTSAYVRQTMRCAAERPWLNLAQDNGWLIEETDDEGVTSLVAVPGVDISYIGGIWKVKPTYDENGDELTPGTMDNRVHVNLYLREPFLSLADVDGYENWKTVLINWMAFPGGNPNKSEVSKKDQGNDLIDTPTINSPTNVWQTP